MTIWNTAAHQAGSLLSTQYAQAGVDHRRSVRYNGPVGPLNEWVDGVRARTGESVPYFDPESATRGADVLILLQDPSEVAQDGSGFISRDNNDQTAHNIFRLAGEAGLQKETTLLWNVIPWWVKNPAMPSRTLSAEASRAAPYLEEVLTLLDSPPKAIVLCGKQSQSAWSRLTASGMPLALADTAIIPAPHPSPLAYNKTDSATGIPNKTITLEAFQLAAAVATGDVSASSVSSFGSLVHKSDSSTQRAAELVMIDLLARFLDVELHSEVLSLKNGTVTCQVDGVDEQRSVVVECFARQGSLAPGQMRKVLADALKLNWIGYQLSPNRPRLILCFADDHAAAPFRSPTRWASHAIADLGVEVHVVDLPVEIRDRIVKQQSVQYR